MADLVSAIRVFDSLLMDLELTSVDARLLRPAQGPHIEAAAGGAVRDAVAASRARSRRTRTGRSVGVVFTAARRRATGNRLRRRRASDCAGAGPSDRRLYRHRCLHQWRRKSAGRRSTHTSSTTSGFISATPASSSTGCLRRASRASTCSIPIRGRSGGIGNGASSRTTASSGWRASQNRRRTTLRDRHRRLCGLCAGAGAALA